jgi:hypothetical protein
MNIRDIGLRFMTTKSCRNKVRYFADFLVALTKNPTAAKWFKEHGTRDPIASIEKWMAQHPKTPSPRRYTVRQSPSQGVAHKPVVVVRQPNNIMNIGVPITPPKRTPSPKYTVRQSPTRGVARRPVTVIRQPNNTMNIGVRRTPTPRRVPPRPATARRFRFPNLRSVFRRPPPRRGPPRRM